MQFLSKTDLYIRISNTRGTGALKLWVQEVLAIRDLCAVGICGEKFYFFPTDLYIRISGTSSWNEQMLAIRNMYIVGLLLGVKANFSNVLVHTYQQHGFVTDMNRMKHNELHHVCQSPSNHVLPAKIICDVCGHHLEGSGKCHTHHTSCNFASCMVPPNTSLVPFTLWPNSGLVSACPTYGYKTTLFTRGAWGREMMARSTTGGRFVVCAWIFADGESLAQFNCVGCR